MKNNNRPSIDGFIPRRPGSELGDQRTNKHAEEAIKPIDRSIHTGERKDTDRIGETRRARAIGRSDIDESLNEIDALTPEPTKKARKQSRKDRKAKKPKSKARRIIKWVMISLGIIIVGVLVYLGYTFIKNTTNMFGGNVFDIFQSQELKKDANGRSNFLIVGTSEDDKGHDGGNLTDTIMVMSIDQVKKDAYMVSIPRDLFVNYDGRACTPGYKGKINAYFSCVNQEDTKEAENERLSETQKFIGNITGLDIQYGVHVNYTVMRDVINAIGGNIKVTIESRNPNGVLDSNFDWKCGRGPERAVKCPRGHFIDFPNGEVTLNAEQALYLAQARGVLAPTYGLEQSNFDRERNQQKVIVAIRDKATSAGTLTNIGAVTGIINALGDNLRTNVQTKEIRTLMDIAQNIPSDKIKSIDLVETDTGNPILTTGTVGNESVVQPRLGQGNYTELRAYIKKQISSDPFVKENPHVSVYNGSETAGIAQTEATKLTDLGFTIDTVGNAPDGSYAQYEVYQINKDKTATAAKLKSLYGVEVKTGTPPMSVVGSTDFVIIIGKAPSN